MAKEEINRLATDLSETLGKELHADIEKLMFAIFANAELSVGVRDGYELTQREITFTSLMIFDDDETVISDKYKPEKLIPNEGNFYFSSEEIVRFNTRDKFFGVIGKKWLENKLGDEFAEAIIFGNHNVSSIDCMLGSVRVNNLFSTPQYLKPGTLVSLQKVEFKNTKYLEVSTFLTKIFTKADSGDSWKLGNFQNRYYWNGYEYSTESIYFRDYDDEYDEGEYVHNFDKNEVYEDDYKEDYSGSYSFVPKMCELCRDSGCCLGISNCGFQ